MTGLSHRNTTFDELAVGQTASIERSVTANDLYVFAHASGNTNPMHMPGTDVDKDGSVDTVAPSLWVGSLISSVLGTILPGAGTLYHGQTFRFLGRASSATGSSFPCAASRSARSRGRCSRQGWRAPTARCCSKASPRSRRRPPRSC